MRIVGQGLPETRIEAVSPVATCGIVNSDGRKIKRNELTLWLSCRKRQLSRNLKDYNRPAMWEQEENKQRILESLNLEDHVLFAPSRLRDREA